MTDRFEASTTEHGHPLTRRQLLGAAAAGTGSVLLAGSGLGRAWASATSLLATFEALFGLGRLGYAATASPFGLDVFTAYPPS
jgi:hypothetical protein